MNTKDFFPAKLIYILNLVTNLRFYIYMHEAWNTEGRLGEENDTNTQKE